MIIIPRKKIRFRVFQILVQHLDVGHFISNEIGGLIRCFILFVEAALTEEVIVLLDDDVLFVEVDIPPIEFGIIEDTDLNAVEGTLDASKLELVDNGRISGGI